MFSIRYAAMEDCAFWYSQKEQHMSKSEFELKVRDKRCYILSSDDRPVGIMRYNLFWDCIPFLTLIYIEEGFRQKGIGREALRFWESEMRCMGYKMAMISTQADEEGQHFYRKLGYKDAGCLLLDIPPYAQPTELFMVKPL